MNRSRFAGSKAAFEQVWLSRDSHLDKVPALYRFTFSTVPRLRIIRSMLPTPSGKAGLCSRHGPSQRRSGQRIVGQGTTSRCISIIQCLRV